MNDPEQSLPIFVKTQDFISWLVQLSNHFPRLHRHTITRRLLDAALDFQEQILEANDFRGHARLDGLTHADAYLSKVRTYLRLVFRLKWINTGQYGHAARMVTEIGRLLGGWQKLTRQQVASAAVTAGTG